MLRCEGLEMRFGATHALRAVDIDVAAGEVHGLLGQNGSGKSTLIKILAGYHVPSAGRVWLSGQEVQLPMSAQTRRELRLAFVHQDLGLLPQLTVLENFLAAQWAAGTARRRVSWRAARGQVQHALRAFEVDLDPSSLVRDLSAVERALLAVVRAIDSMKRPNAGDAEPGLLVLDEPTVFLASSDSRHLYALMRQLSREGSGVLFVSHDIDEVKRVTDRITVLRDGRKVLTAASGDLAVSEIVALVVAEDGGNGRPPARSRLAASSGRSRRTHHESPAASRAVLSVKDLYAPGVRGVSFSARSGTIVGLTGLPGSGYDDILYLLHGAKPADRGQLTVAGREVSLHGMTPAKARSLGIALVPSDRLAEGCVPHLSLTDNNSLPALAACRRGPLLSRAKARELASRQISRFGLRIASPDATYSTMSGGNQQKGILAKWLDLAPLIVLLNQPTQGVDVGARAEIWRLLRATSRGCIMLCASLDHDELVAICDVLLVFRRGRVVASLQGEMMTASAIAQATVEVA